MEELLIVFIALATIIQFWAFIDMAYTKRMENKGLWMLILLLLPLGAMFYFQNRKKLIRTFSPQFRQQPLL